MDQMLQRLYKGTFRSYKVFRRSGDMKLHNFRSFQEIDINDNKVLTINIYKDQVMKTVVRTNRWTLEFKHRKYFLNIGKDDAYEVISLNHTGMVLADRVTEEKIFYARLQFWEDFINTGIANTL